MISNKQNRQGILLVISAMSIFAVQDILIKSISESASLFQILFFRSIIGISIILAFQKLAGYPIKIWTAYPFLVVLRGFLFFLGYSTFYFSISQIPIANATVLFLISPFFITLLSIYFLESQIDSRRWIALIIGFSGVIFVAQPESDDFNWIYILPICVAAVYSVSMMIVKVTSDKDTVYQQVIVMYSITAILSVAISLLPIGIALNTLGIDNQEFLYRPWSISDKHLLFYLCVISIIGTTGFVLLHSAYRTSDPAIIAPYEYSGLLVVLILAWIFFEELPSPISFVGMLLIVLSGLYILHSEKSKPKQPTTKSSLR